MEKVEFVKLKCIFVIWINFTVERTRSLLMLAHGCKKILMTNSFREHFHEWRCKFFLRRKKSWNFQMLNKHILPYKKIIDVLFAFAHCFNFYRHSPSFAVAMQLAVENSKQKTDQQLIDFCVCVCVVRNFSRLCFFSFTNFDFIARRCWKPPAQQSATQIKKLNSESQSKGQVKTKSDTSTE